MRLLNFFKAHPEVQSLPAGSLTVDCHGKIVMSTVSSDYSPALLRDIAASVLMLLEKGRNAELPLQELSLHFGSLLISAREQSGGAMIFLSPKVPFTSRPRSRL